MDGLEMLYTRRSVRSYKQDLISDDIIQKIVKAGQLAATARNEQPWEIVVVKDVDKKMKIANTTDHGKFIADAAVCIVVFCEDTKYYLEDGSAAIQNMICAARYFGIGSCWVAGDKKAYASTMNELCGVSESKKLIGLIALGYPKDEEAFKERRIRVEGYKEI